MTDLSLSAQDSILHFLAPYCDVSHHKGRSEGRINSWRIYLDHRTVTQLITPFLVRCSSSISDADFVVGMPNSGIPIATLIYNSFGIPLISFAGDSMTLKPVAKAAVESCENAKILLVDTVINTGKSLDQALHRLEGCTVASIMCEVMILNDTLGALRKSIDAEISRGRLNYMLRMSDVVNRASSLSS